MRNETVTDLNGRPLPGKRRYGERVVKVGKGRVKWIDRDGPKWSASDRVRYGWWGGKG